MIEPQAAIIDEYEPAVAISNAMRGIGFCWFMEDRYWRINNSSHDPDTSERKAHVRNNKMTDH